ncbi:MAG TPA: response regulator, partial [Bryobacteraceae bacterium]|nr:response regulator [Bryobacteraceae bacterium]
IAASTEILLLLLLLSRFAMPALVDILLVEDNPADVRLAQETLHIYKLQNVLHVVNNGRDALRYLRGEGPFCARRMPDLLMLDLNLPVMDGVEVLEELAGDLQLKELPVVILASTRLDEKLLRRYNISTDCFILKPLTLERYLDAIRCFPQFGLSIVRVAEA